MLKIEINPKHPIVGKTYRFRNSKVLNEKKQPTWEDITAPTPEDALAHLGWKAEDIDIAKVWKCSGKVGESGQVTSGGWGKLILPAENTYPTYVKTKKDRAEYDARQAEIKDNLAKGLTMFGHIKAYDGESRTFYLNNVAIKCSIDYDISPHLEFYSVKDKEPSVLTETGYRSHFTSMRISDYPTMEAVIEAAVKSIMNEERKKSKKYTLTWEPSLEYLKHSPQQLTLFGGKDAVLC